MAKKEKGGPKAKESDGYENPSFGSGDKGWVGEGGDKSSPVAPGGKVSGDYDNSVNKEPGGGAPGSAANSAQNAQAGQKDKFAGKSSSDGYENVKTDQDFGFKGPGKKPKFYAD